MNTFTCEFCGRCFTRRNNHYRHRKRFHKDEIEKGIFSFSYIFLIKFFANCWFRAYKPIQVREFLLFNLLIHFVLSIKMKIFENLTIPLTNVQALYSMYLTFIILVFKKIDTLLWEEVSHIFSWILMLSVDGWVLKSWWR